MTEDILDILAQETLTEATHKLAVSDTAENLWFSGEKHIDFKGRYSAILNIRIRFYDTISIEKQIIVERIINYVSYCCCQRSFRTRYIYEPPTFQIPIYWNRSMFHFMDYLWTLKRQISQIFVLESKTTLRDFISFVEFSWSNALYDSPVVQIIKDEYFKRFSPPSPILVDQANQWFRVIAPKRNDDAQIELAKFYYFRLEIKK